MEYINNPLWNAKNYTDNPFLKLLYKDNPSQAWPYRGFDKATLDHLAVVSVAGLWAEILAFGNVEGGIVDLYHFRQRSVFLQLTKCWIRKWTNESELTWATPLVNCDYSLEPWTPLPQSWSVMDQLLSVLWPLNLARMQGDKMISWVTVNAVEGQCFNKKRQDCWNVRQEH
jgi:hypothetical protein